MHCTANAYSSCPDPSCCCWLATMALPATEPVHAGMPEAVSISKQALARGYALLAINSANRDVGSGARCWRCAEEKGTAEQLLLEARAQGGAPHPPQRCGSELQKPRQDELCKAAAALLMTLPSAPRCSWGSDATDVRDIVKAFLKDQGLGSLPLYFTGCSCACFRLACCLQQRIGK